MTSKPPYESIVQAAEFVTLKNGDWAEFGTAKGVSSRIMYDLMPENAHLHLFDSFEGLPEDWCDKDGVIFLPKNKYKITPPEWIFKKPQIVVHKGMFSDTIPLFVREQQKPLSFIHIDCDLYSSTKTVFDNIDKLIVKGTIICFDEFFNYRGWEVHEYKAFHEYVDKYNRKYELLGRTDTEKAWLRITN